MPDIHVTPGHWWWDKDMPVPTVSALLAEGAQRLQGLEAPRFEAEVLLAELLRCERAGLWAHPARSVPVACAERYGVWIEERARGMPSAYLMGRREFWSLMLQVTRETLVPRPETELLVSLALARIRATEARELLDLGTGSGAIALAIQSECPALRITATDRSPAGLQCARENAQRLGLDRVEFCEGDWYRAVAGRCFDLIVSNPPYVETGSPHWALLQHEPRLALDGGADGLTALRAVIAGATGHLHPGGMVLVEHGCGQGAAVRALFREHGYPVPCTVTDLAGHERASSAVLS
ncbi:MAG: peptide chain release factor N(5)-glutamine methyltransferase [Gammaproteobacteria bacterium]